MEKVIVRYAPSPTGIPHIGNIRTALYNFLLAKSQKGKFILRIEDTDRKRFVPESIESIEESLKVLGLNWDEVCRQSERLSVYQRALKLLKEKNLVYEDDGAWRFKVEKGRKLEWNDLVHGQVEFTADVIEDFVIVKSDGYPTYHFASVVDDHDLQISHVLRGDEWISSTPKHLLLYQAFGWNPPQFIHVPAILGPDKKKLSKREGARSVLEYIDDGYLPEALVNFLALLGWSPKGDRELFTLDELIAEFQVERLNKNSPIFSIEKLKWLNGQWIRKLDENKYIEKIKNFYPNYDSLVTVNAAPLTQERVSTLADYKKIANFFYEPPKEIPPIPNTVSAGTISQLESTFRNLSDWEAPNIKQAIDGTAQAEKVDRVGLITGVRNIVSGSTVTPPLYESLETLGQEETVKRLEKYLEKGKKTNKAK